MTYAALDAALVRLIGAANATVFRISRGRVLLHRFGAMPHARLTEIDRVPELDSPAVDYLRDGDDVILLVPARAAEPRWLRDLRDAMNVTLEIEEDASPPAVSAITVVSAAGEEEADAEETRRLREQVTEAPTTRELEARVLPIGEADRAEVTTRLIRGATLGERYEMRKQRLVPSVRLKAH